VTRKDLKNMPKEAYLPDQALTVYDSLYRYTAAGAIASCDDHNKGYLKEGYLADCVVVEGPIFDEVLDAKVMMTIFEGKIAYKKQ
jgi:predicted amidohydrolase YtcJ